MLFSFALSGLWVSLRGIVPRAYGRVAQTGLRICGCRSWHQNMRFSGVFGEHGQDAHATHTGKMPVPRFGRHALKPPAKHSYGPVGA